MNRRSTSAPLLFRPLPALLTVLLAACSSTAIDTAQRQSRAGDHEAAYETLQAAAQDRPADAALRTELAAARDRVVVRALAMAELALANGRGAEAADLVERLRRIDPAHPRLQALQSGLERLQRAGATTAAATSATGTAVTAGMAAPAPRAAPTAAEPPAAPSLGPAFQKPVTLEFREAPLRQVFEALARTSGVNFVFDKDVRSDARVTVFLRGTTLDEAVRVILATQQLDRKLLNDSTVMVYPNTAAKQREHQELVTRTLYLSNADVRQVLNLVRTMSKTRDLYADERLNVLVVRDTPEVVRMVEALVATVDLPEPEVMLAVEVMEVASDRLSELGLAWPTEVQVGLPGATGPVLLSGAADFRASVLNPALVATLRSTTGAANLLANPTIRARNREKARVQIGEKLPVFSTTSATANVGASTSVTTLEVGLKLDVEPTVQLDGDVTIRVGLEVSNVLRSVTGPGGSLAYQVGSRLASTSLRLKDGQTQVLSGLINDEDRKSATGVPGLADLPLVGRLFGVHGRTRNKTEIVMLITPRIVRQLPQPTVAAATLNSGTDAQPGQAPLRLQRQARVGLGPAAGGRAAIDAAPATADAPATPAAPEPAGATLLLAATPEAAVGETVSVTLSNRSGAMLRGELEFDAARLQPAQPVGAPGRWPFTLTAREDAVLVLRVLAPAAGGSVGIAVSGLSATAPTGEVTEARVEGAAVVNVRPLATAAPGVSR